MLDATGHQEHIAENGASPSSARVSAAEPVASHIALAVASYWCEFAPDSVRSLAAHSRSTARRSLAVPADCRTHASSGAASVYSQSSAAEPSVNVSPGYSVGSRPSTSRSPGRSIAYTPAAVAR